MTREGRVCPTARDDRTGRQKRLFRRRRTAIARRRTKLSVPQIFVATKPGPYGPRYAHAHLRNRRGYVYLTWRDGDRVRTFYLGKASRNALRPGPSSDQVRTSAAGAGGAAGLELRRAKKKVLWAIAKRRSS